MNLPLLLVLATYFLPLTFRVTLTFFIASFRSVFKVTVYFLVLADFLKVLLAAVSFGVAFLTKTYSVFVDGAYFSFPANDIINSGV